MILTCPSCRSRYLVSDNAIPPAGRAVRCAACKHVWTEYPAAEPVGADTAPASYAADQRVAEPEVAVAAMAAASDAPAASADYGHDDGAAPDEAGASLVAPPLPSRLKIPVLAEAKTAEAQAAADTAQAADESVERSINSLRRSMQSTRRSSSDSRRSSSRRKRLPGKWIAIGAGITLMVGANLFLWKNTLIENSDMARSFYAALGLATPVPHDASLGAQVLEINYPPPPPPRELENGGYIQEITGSIENPTSRTVRIPTMKGTMLDENGNVVFTWTFPPPTLVLNGGQTVMFDTTVRDFPTTARQLKIGFDTGADATGEGN